MASVADLLSTLQAVHILRALEQLDAGTKTAFADSTKFDVLHQGKRYAPKEVAGLALENAYRRSFGPRDFSGGESSSAFRALRRCGFVIVPKAESTNPVSFSNSVSEILSLQQKYSPENSSDMQRRGFLVRTVLRDFLYGQAERFGPLFAGRGYQYAVEGSDGKGRKVMSPWVRIYDPQMSPSATLGWYVVIHFSSRGDFFYLTIGCGATTFKGGSLVDNDPEELYAKVSWARTHLAKEPHWAAPFTDPIELHGNHLSRQFEKSTAFARRYEPYGFDQAQFLDDLAEMIDMLIAIYEAETLGKLPSSEAPEIRELRSLMPKGTLSGTKGRGQGRFLNSAERTAVELHAMSTVLSALPQYGFTDIKDVSASRPYDFCAKRGGLDWFVEVKGTTSARAESFLLTANELALHRAHKGRTVLAIVHDIDLDRNGGEPSASGGQLLLEDPWDPDLWAFEPMAYVALRKNNAARPEAIDT